MGTKIEWPLTSEFRLGQTVYVLSWSVWYIKATLINYEVEGPYRITAITVKENEEQNDIYDIWYTLCVISGKDYKRLLRQRLQKAAAVIKSLNKQKRAEHDCQRYCNKEKEI